MQLSHILEMSEVYDMINFELLQCVEEAHAVQLSLQDRMQGHITGALACIEEMAQIVTVPASS